MSASGFQIGAAVLPNPAFDSSNIQVVNDTLGFSFQDNSIQTVSNNNPNAYDVIQGVLYVPQLDSDSSCVNISQPFIPNNVTTTAGLFQPSNLPLVAIAPWTTSECVSEYFTQMRADAVRGAIFFLPPEFAANTTGVGSQYWSLGINGNWRANNQYPMYSVSAMEGSYILNQMARYSGNMSHVPNGDQLVNIYNPHDQVKLFVRINLSQSSGIPSLWVFLIIVLAILLVVVIFTTVIMHFIQRRQRLVLQRRVQNGEVDLETLGIKRMNVPQEELDKMPQYLFTTKNESTKPVLSKDGVPVREVPFSQPTCPICLDDFVHNETSVRELPCKHIFHPDCIDPFLRDNSSLCPMCKKSALPAGFCPVQVTNLMVRRERLMRRMRERRRAEIQALIRQNQPVSRQRAIWNRIHGWVSSPPAVSNLNIDRQRGTGVVEDVELAGTTVTTETLAVPTFIAADRRNTMAVPPELATRSAAERRAWRRERFVRQQENNYIEQARLARQVDEGRPMWRRAASRLFPGI